MSGAVFRAMLLGLVRDRAALAMSFLLPVVFFLIFAAIFAGATGEQLRLKVAVADEVDDEVSRRLVRAGGCGRGASAVALDGETRLDPGIEATVEPGDVGEAPRGQESAGRQRQLTLVVDQHDAPVFRQAVHGLVEHFDAIV